MSETSCQECGDCRPGCTCEQECKTCGTCLSLEDGRAWPDADIPVFCYGCAHDRIRQLAEALRILYDFQNGPPLEKYRKQWNEGMALAKVALADVRQL